MIDKSPNFNYIKEISPGDTEFKKNIIAILKTELPIEINDFNENFRQKKYLNAAKNVHKLKIKISLLGLPEAHQLASNFEKELKNKKTTLIVDFNEVLVKISKFVQNL
jgi:HPt (histidine-containing phosphotransfer) domain-containing protein